MDYSHVFDHPFDPRTVRVWDKLLLVFDFGFVEVSYLDGPVTIIDDEHVVKVGDEIRLVNGQKLYQPPLGYIEDTAVYAGDVTHLMNGSEVTLSESLGGSAFLVETSSGVTLGISAGYMTLSKPRERKVGYIALSSVYGAAPPDIHPDIYAHRHIFKDEETARRIYPDSHVVEVSWYDKPVPAQFE